MYKQHSALSYLFRLEVTFLMLVFSLILTARWVGQAVPALPIVSVYGGRLVMYDVERKLALSLAGDYAVPSTFMNITPAVSPDKRWIAVENSSDGVLLFNLLNGIQTRLPLAFAQPIWSPDSRYVVTVPLKMVEDMNIQSNAQWMEIQVADIYSGEVRQIVPSYQYLRIWALGWSANNQQITFVAMKSPEPIYTFYRVNRDGGGFHALDCQIGSGGTDQMVNFMFAPGGEQVAFAAQAGKHYHIFVLNLDDCTQSQITDGEPYDDNPAWSPDGTQIAFISARDGQQDIYSMNADGSHVARITETADNEMLLGWSPDGCCLLYESYPAGGGITAYHYADLRDGSLYMLNLDLWPGQVQSLPAWGS